VVVAIDHVPLPLEENLIKFWFFTQLMFTLVASLLSVEAVIRI